VAAGALSINAFWLGTSALAASSVRNLALYLLFSEKPKTVAFTLAMGSLTAIPLRFLGTLPWSIAAILPFSPNQ